MARDASIKRAMAAVELGLQHAATAQKAAASASRAAEQANAQVEVALQALVEVRHVASASQPTIAAAPSRSVRTKQRRSLASPVSADGESDAESLSLEVSSIASSCTTRALSVGETQVESTSSLLSLAAAAPIGTKGPDSRKHAREQSPKQPRKQCMPWEGRVELLLAGRSGQPADTRHAPERELVLEECTPGAKGAGEGKASEEDLYDPVGSASNEGLEQATSFLEGLANIKTLLNCAACHKF